MLSGLDYRPETVVRCSLADQSAALSTLVRAGSAANHLVILDLVAAPDTVGADLVAAGLLERQPVAVLVNPTVAPAVYLGLLRQFPACHLLFSGAVTHAKNAWLHELAFDCPTDRLLLCSEAPHHAAHAVVDRDAAAAGTASPASPAGDVSHPGHCLLTAVALATHKGCPWPEVLEAARLNQARACACIQREAAVEDSPGGAADPVPSVEGLADAVVPEPRAVAGTNPSGLCEEA